MNTGLYNQQGVWDPAMVAGQRHLMTALLDVWPAGLASVLDVGCGDGKLTRGLLEHAGGDFFGIDGSREALSRLTIPAAIADIQALPIATGAVDGVVCTDVLEHVADGEEPAAWGELFRVARRHVLVAVPYRENLVEGVTRCPACGHEYHVNWHQRSYCLADFIDRIPEGWRLRLAVLSGESWSQVDPIETQFRRVVFDERARWDQSVCPRCGATGTDAEAPAPLTGVMAVALGEALYGDASSAAESRNHTELLLLVSKDGEPQAPLSPPPVVVHRQTSHRLSWASGLRGPNLIAYPRVPRLVRGVDGSWVAQFPRPSDNTLVLVSATQAAGVSLVVEDGMGVLINRRMDLVPGPNRLDLPRRCVPGYYGVLVRVPRRAPVTEVQLGSRGREILIAEPAGSAAVGYFETSSRGIPLYVQVSERMWLGDDQLDPFQPVQPVRIRWRERLAAVTDPIASVQAERSNLATQLHNVADHYRVLQDQAQALQDQTQALQGQAQALQQENKVLHENNQAINESNQALNDKNQVLQGLTETLHREAEVLRARCSAVEARYRRIERVFEILGGRHGRGLLERFTR